MSAAFKLRLDCKHVQVLANLQVNILTDQPVATWSQYELAHVTTMWSKSGELTRQSDTSHQSEFESVATAQSVVVVLSVRLRWCHTCWFASFGWRNKLRNTWPDSANLVQKKECWEPGELKGQKCQKIKKSEKSNCHSQNVGKTKHIGKTRLEIQNHPIFDQNHVGFFCLWILGSKGPHYGAPFG